jgi:hypothetical protein
MSDLFYVVPLTPFEELGGRIIGRIYVAINDKHEIVTQHFSSNDDWAIHDITINLKRLGLGSNIEVITDNSELNINRIKELLSQSEYV